MTGPERRSGDGDQRTYARAAASVLCHVLLAVLIAVATLVVLAPTLRNTFVYDDHATLLGNRTIDHLTRDTVATLFGGFHLNDYYPVFYLSLAIDRAIWNMRPLGFHLTNLVLHVLNVCLVYVLVFRLADRDEDAVGGATRPNRWLLAVIAALLFAVHPNHVEPVAWITGRKVLLACLWGLLAVHCYLTALTDQGRRWPWLGAGCLCAALACMSNVYAVVVPALVVLIDRVYGRRSWWRAACVNWPFGLVALGAAALKVASRTGGVARDSQFASRAEWLWTTISLYWDNVRSLFVPSGRNILYVNDVIRSPGETAFLAGLAAMGVTVGLLWAMRRRRLSMVGLLWFLLALAPTSQVARHHIFRADRYLYFPGVGACLLAGLVLATMWSWPRRWLWRGPVVILFLIAFLAFAGASRDRSHDWRDDRTLWQASLEQEERNADAHQSLGCALMRHDENEQALLHLERCIELRPLHVDAHNTLSALMLKMGQTDRAVRHGRLAVQIRPEQAEPKFSLGLALRASGECVEALARLETGLKQKPNDIGARFYRAEVLAELGRDAQAVPAYRHALDLKGSYVEARYGLALALIRLERFDEAEGELSKIVAVHPEFAEAHCKQAELSRRRGDYGEAITRYRRAVKARPDLHLPRKGLAWTLATCPRAEFRNGVEALAVLEPVVEGTGRDDPTVLDTLAAAHAEAGQFAQAVEAAGRALTLAKKSGNEDLANELQQRRIRYAASQPYHESAR